MDRRFVADLRWLPAGVGWGVAPPWLPPALVALVVGGALGIAVAAATPLYAVAGLIGLAGLIAVLLDVRIGVFGFVGVATLLPFAVIPVAIGVVKLTLVDVCLTSVLLVWLLRLLADRTTPLQGSFVALPVVLYLGVCLTSFVLGTAYLTTSADARLFVKLLNSVIFFFSVVNCVRDVPTLRRVVLALTGGGALAGLIAIVLYYLPPATAERLLASLAPVGYPSTDILQRDADTHVLKAIGTSIDHNILGATLMICGTLTVGLLLLPGSRRRKLGLVGALGLEFVALLLTYSRGSLVGFLVGCAAIATLRYRRLWLIGALLLVAVPFFPELAQSSFVTHLASGIQVKDKATAMRFGEYKDAFRLIGEYPWFGVGFGAAPDVDLYVGVSSIYLLLAENVGLVGVALWLWVIGRVGLRAVRQLVHVRGNAEASGLAVGCFGALVAVLVAGLFDHHFVDLHFPHVVALVWLIVGLLVVGLRLDAAAATDDRSVVGLAEAVERGVYSR